MQSCYHLRPSEAQPVSQLFGKAISFLLQSSPYPLQEGEMHDVYPPLEEGVQASAWAGGGY